MERLNCFNTYMSKDSSHEDQLTRAYLILLKYSFHVFSSFINYVEQENNNEYNINLLNLLNDIDWNFETQKGNPSIETNFLGSILITDEKPTSNFTVQSTKRNARYDGLISFGSQLTLIIENKPNSDHIWFSQLNPSKENLAEETKVLQKPIILEWKKIIKNLNTLLTFETLNGPEKMMINDFLNYIDHNFPKLNPYDSFKLCKSSHKLLERRIFNILKEIAIDENMVKYHNGWGYYIETPSNLHSIQKIGLILDQDSKGWDINLSLYFGDTQSQAKSFYSKNPDFSKVTNSKWSDHPNFHFGFMTSNLVWFKTPKNQLDSKSYIQFWKENKNLIRQHARSEIHDLVSYLVNEKIIIIDENKQTELNNEFFGTKRQTLNICPGFGIISTLDSVYCEKNDNDTYLLKDITQRIQQGLSIINYDVTSFIKAQYLV
ncbi:hypothetical protein QTA56_04425 [Acinetobacter sp. VNH17]|uniref:Uncharacterized protein n=1 Tax=Acinetobacter thutiue TaxID=2998078 RepID=A0ABT7WLN0_9GAMM|nr:hypothetical protein [Acinetobacter thutiue]MCY6411387.1 hypothetical protein [Acinetobacter thutiue]MDN0013489.1 hypothetical protein [Acinetobacter thutiue]